MIIFLVSYIFLLYFLFTDYYQQAMISPNHFNPESRNNKNIHPSSPNLKRKNVDYTLQNPINTQMQDYTRKDINNNVVNHSGNALSPSSHYYNQKII